MTTITLANTESDILDDLEAALQDARHKGKPVFKSVVISLTTDDAMKLEGYRDTPLAVITWNGTQETDTVEGVKHRRMIIDIIGAAFVTADTDKDRVVEGARLQNAIHNTIETTPPTKASAWGSGTYYQEKLAWGEPSMQSPSSEAADPWVIVIVPLTIGYVIASGTEH